MKYGPFKCMCFLRPMTVLEDQAIIVNITQGLYLILSSVHAVRTVYYRCEPRLRSGETQNVNNWRVCIFNIDTEFLRLPLYWSKANLAAMCLDDRKHFGNLLQNFS